MDRSPALEFYRPAPANQSAPDCYKDENRSDDSNGRHVEYPVKDLSSTLYW